MDTVTQKPTQRELDTFVNNHVFACQSALIDELLKTNVFQYDDIENLEYPDPDMLEQRISEMKTQDEMDGTRKDYTEQYYIDCATEECEANGNMNQNEIFEWYIVSPWLANQLKRNHEPILDNEFGTWWGRTTTGQAISLDQVIEDICTNSK